MIEPPSPAAIRSPTSADSRNGPLRLTPTTLSKSSSVHVGERRVQRGDAGVVDEDVDAPELLVGGVDEPLEVVPASDVARARRARGRRRPRSSAATSRAGVRLAAGDDEVGAGRRERARDRQAEPARAAGDERDAAGQVEQVAGAAAASRVMSGRARTASISPSGRARRSRRAARRAARSGSSSKTEPSVDALGDRPAASSSSRWPTTSQTTSSGCSATVRGDPELAGDLERGARAVAPGSRGCARSAGGARAGARRRAARGSVTGGAVAGEQPAQRHLRRCAAGCRGSARASARARRAARSGAQISVFEEIARQQVVAGERERVAVVDEERVGRAVARAARRPAASARPPGCGRRRRAGMSARKASASPRRKSQKLLVVGDRRARARRGGA